MVPVNPRPGGSSDRGDIIVPTLRIRQIMDELDSLGGMTPDHMILITELVATCLMARPQPKSNAERQKDWRDRNKVTLRVTKCCNGDNINSNPENPPKAPPSTRLPDDWRPSDELWDWGKTKLSHDTLRFETAAFRDYWHAQPGARGKKLDWAKTWKNWIREAVRRRTRGQNGQGLALVPKVDGPKRTWAEIKAEREAKQ